MTDQIVLSKQDYYLISNLMGVKSQFSPYCSSELEKELRTAKILSPSDIPDDVVRINSVVKILELDTHDFVSFQLVRPSEANLKESRISILAPLAAALIGYKKGDTVRWKVPSGIKRYRILDVNNNDL
jgi:regulator of nucleoside diphosphate kinase